MLPNGLEEIGDGWFRGCAFCRVFVPGSVRRVSETAFKDCEGLTQVVLGHGSPLAGAQALSQYQVIVEPENESPTDEAPSAENDNGQK